MTAPLLVALKAHVRVLVAAVGLRSTASDLTYLSRRPGLLLRSVLAIVARSFLGPLALEMALRVPLRTVVDRLAAP